MFYQNKFHESCIECIPPGLSWHQIRFHFYTYFFQQLYIIVVYVHSEKSPVRPMLFYSTNYRQQIVSAVCSVIQQL